MTNQIKLTCYACNGFDVRIYQTVSKRIFPGGPFHILNCQSCSSTTTFPAPNLDVSHYEITHRVDHVPNDVDGYSLGCISSIINDYRMITGADPASVLDVGCGNGDLLKALKLSGINASGFDPSSIMVSVCNEKSLSVVKSSINEFSNYSNFDLFVFQQAIYSGLVPKIFKKTWYGWSVKEHYFYWTKNSFLRFLSSLDIVPIKISTCELYYCWTPFSVKGFKSFLLFNLQYIVSRISQYIGRGDSAMFFIRGRKMG
jgi:SAM-dependent methyltransferase